MKNLLLNLVFLSFISSCALASKSVDPGRNPSFVAEKINIIAEVYVKLALSLDEWDRGYILSYYGEDSIREKVINEKISLEKIITESEKQSISLIGMEAELSHKHPLYLRFIHLQKQLNSLRDRAKIIAGKLKPKFDEESKLLYDFVAPKLESESFLSIRSQLDKIVKGEGSLEERMEQFNKKFHLPADLIIPLYQELLAECRAATKKYLKLPDKENVEIKPVTGKTWNAFNQSQKNSLSIVSVSIDSIIHPDKILDLAAHEAYPGHHVLNILMEQDLYKKNGWIEFSILPLYSPSAFMIEGTASVAVEIMFSQEEKIAIYKNRIFPAAKLDPSDAAYFAEVSDLLQKLSFARVEITRKYLDGIISFDQAAEEASKAMLRPKSFTEKQMKFAEKYRSYIINYTWGKKYVADYIQKQALSNTKEDRWKAYIELLRMPRPASSLGL